MFPKLSELPVRYGAPPVVCCEATARERSCVGYILVGFAICSARTKLRHCYHCIIVSNCPSEGKQHPSIYSAIKRRRGWGWGVGVTLLSGSTITNSTTVIFLPTRVMKLYFERVTRHTLLGGPAKGLPFHATLPHLRRHALLAAVRIVFLLRR